MIYTATKIFHNMYQIYFIFSRSDFIKMSKNGKNMIYCIKVIFIIMKLEL
jgi:hypothetical protein